MQEPVRGDAGEDPQGLRREARAPVRAAAEDHVQGARWRDREAHQAPGHPGKVVRGQRPEGRPVDGERR
eukprot:1563479-Pyramimonas_sp.AAC.1